MLNLHCESNSRFQADDRLTVLSISVGKDSVGSLKKKISTSHPENKPEVLTHGGDFFGYRNILLERSFSLLDRALEINIFGLVAEIGLSIDESDQSIFDLQSNICLFVNGLQQSTNSFNGQVATTVNRLACVTLQNCFKRYSRHWGVWIQVDVIEDKQIIGVLCFAVCERVLAWNSCAVAEDFLAAEKR
jgi:hypothetical protein